MENQKEPKKNTNKGPGFYWIYFVILFFILFSFFFLPDKGNQRPITFKEFDEELVPKKLVDHVVIVNGRLVEVYLTPEALKLEEYKSANNTPWMQGQAPHLTFKIISGEKFEEYLQKHKIPYVVEEQSNYLDIFFQFLFPVLIIIGIWFLLIRRMGSGGPGGNIFNIGKSQAKLFDGSKVDVTFKDVAGLDEVKQEVVEIVEFLRHPEKYRKLGGKIPRGVLLVGPPGTGKTLLAKAVAGEAKVAFFSISGSDFVEMFVGVGAARVRDLFKKAKEKAPAIIFIDEIDAIGRSRNKIVVGGGNEERENTLNQLLVEMDGFDSRDTVIIIGATNRPDILDRALLRPGRFDRIIAIDKPDVRERAEIFKVHLRNIKVAPDVDPRRLAEQTPGFVGADIMNICNEAALIAARKNKDLVTMEDFNEAIDKVIGGLEKKNKIISPEEKRIVAYHEAGHAITGWFLEHAEPLVKVSIIPRGVAALGYAQYSPKEQYLYTYAQLLDMMCMTLGGRAAEEIVLKEISTGAQNDLEKVTKMAYSMVAIYGMNPEIGQVSLKIPSEEFPTQKMYSEDLARKIDEEVRKLIANAYARTKELLTKHIQELETLAKVLLEKEVLYKEDLEELIGKRPFPEPEINSNPASN